jgi:hypothetical protein
LAKRRPGPGAVRGTPEHARADEPLKKKDENEFATAALDSDLDAFIDPNAAKNFEE